MKSKPSNQRHPARRHSQRLDTTVAVVCADQADYAGVAWGYTGSGPGTLAVTVGRLLDDIAAPALNAYDDEPNLEELFQQEHPDGTVLTRAQLEAARTRRPRPEH